METKIYLDNAATTKISDSAFEAMLPFLKESYGNAGALYSLGRKAAAALKNSRITCSKFLNCEPNDIYFTSGGTESDNWAICAVAEMMKEQGKDHIITSAFEHHAVLNTLKNLEKKGFNITYLPVHENGIVRINELEQAVNEKTALVSIMYVNNEIGTIQPISEIGKLCRKKGVVFHTDAVQAAPHLKIDVQKDNVDLLSISGHKLHAPKGTGLLYCRKDIGLKPFINGGKQERGLRGGTENISGIVGLAAALLEIEETRETTERKLKAFSEKITAEIIKAEGVRLNGDENRRVFGVVNFSFDGLEGESLVLQLDLKGIACSSGSACTSGNDAPSHVLMSLGMNEEQARGSLRISMSRFTEEWEIDEFLKTLFDIVKKMRDCLSK